MYENLAVFSTAHAMARHAGSRQGLTAANIANADTPGYRAMSIASFADSYSAPGAPPKVSRAGHMTGVSGAALVRPAPSDTEPAPNGNSVSLDEEMLRAVEAEREHNRALTIYRHALGLIRLGIAR